MIRMVMLQVPIRCLALCICPCCQDQRELTRLELRLQLTMHIELSDLIAQYTNLPLYSVMHIRSAMFVNRSAYVGVVGPFIIVDTVVRHAVTQEPLTLIHSIYRSSELQLRVIRLAKRHRYRVPNCQHIGRVVRLGTVAVDIVVEPLVGGLLQITSVRVIGLKYMTERHQRDVFYFDCIPHHPMSVFYHLYRIVILPIHGDGILVMQISAQVSVRGHGVQPYRQIFCIETTVQLRHVL